MKIELTMQQIEEVVREDLKETLQILLDSMEDPAMVAAVDKVLRYYSVQE